MSFINNFETVLQNAYIFAPFFFFLGACLGSFYNVVSFRYPLMIDGENAQDIHDWLEEKKLTIPEGLSKFFNTINLSFPSSHCYSCKTPLKWWHNIPVLSFIILRGKCGHCGVKYSAQYPIIEFLAGLTLMGSYLLFFPKLGLVNFLLISLFFMIGFLLILIDIKVMMLPDSLNYFLLWIGLIAAAFGYFIYPNMTIKQSILGAASGFLFFYILSFLGKKLKGEEVMGGGDLKLIAAIGAFLGVYGAFFTIFLSPFLGLVSWLIVKLVNKEQFHIPYGPSLIITSWIYILYGSSILNFFNIPI
jgi:leader peptidase (prepilin peptidase)/N-methyltransferase